MKQKWFKMKKQKDVWMPNNIAGRQVDFERKKFHLEDYGIFQVSAVAGEGLGRTLSYAW
jgi:hypothetical protein